MINALIDHHTTFIDHCFFFLQWPLIWDVHTVFLLLVLVFFSSHSTYSRSINGGKAPTQPETFMEFECWEMILCYKENCFALAYIFFFESVRKGDPNIWLTNEYFQGTIFQKVQISLETGRRESFHQCGTSVCRWWSGSTCTHIFGSLLWMSQLQLTVDCQFNLSNCKKLTAFNKTTTFLCITFKAITLTCLSIRFKSIWKHKTYEWNKTRVHCAAGLYGSLIKFEKNVCSCQCSIEFDHMSWKKGYDTWETKWLRGDISFKWNTVESWGSAFKNHRDCRFMTSPGIWKCLTFF